MKAIQKSISFVVLLGVFASVLTSCGFFYPRELQKMSFEYTLTEAEVEEVLSLAEKLEEYVDAVNEVEFLSSLEHFQERMNYIQHQFIVAKVKFYADLEDKEADEQYTFSEDSWVEVQEASLNVLKKLYRSELEAKEEVFADWTQEDIDELLATDQEVIALEKEQNDLIYEYLSLENPGSEEWSASLEGLYFQFVDVSRRIADHYGYNDYYEYAAKEIYMR